MRTTKLRSKLSLLFIALAAMIAIPAAIALADIVKNDVVAGGNDTITTTGTSTINYEIKNSSSGGGGFSNCDPADGSSLTLTINKPAEVTASPGSLTFNSCDSPKPVQFSSTTAGDYNITVTAADSHGNYNVSSAAFTLHVTAPPPPTNTAPTLSLPSTNPTAEATGPGGAAVSYNATATDKEDGSLTPTCSPASGDTFALGSTQVNCSVTDSGGLSASGFFTVTVVDTTAPGIASHENVTEEATSANGAVVNYTAPATSDAVDGPGSATCSPASGSTFPLGTTTVKCDATDAAGNPATQTSFTVTVADTTAPVIASHADVSATATSKNGALVNYTSPATSDAVDGNGTAICTSDSGLKSGDTFPVGSTTVTCKATDAAGNIATSTTFKVNVAYDWSNFLQPINATGTQSVFKMGSTVPVKFNLTGDSAGIADGTFYLKYVYTGAGDGAGEAEAVATTTGTTGTQFRYDATSGQYIFNWSTKTITKPGNYELRVYTDSAYTNLLGKVAIELKK